MPLTVSNPRDLLLVELADILFVERMLSFEVIPELLKQVSDPQLGGTLAEHLEQTKRHVINVEAAFRAAGAEPSSNHSKPFVGLKEQHAEIGGGGQGPGRPHHRAPARPHPPPRPQKPPLPPPGAGR